MLVRLKGGFLGPEKKIFTDGGQSSLSTAIRELPAPLEQISNARYREYLLVMRNSQNYILFAPNGQAAAQIGPRGLMGGWDIEAGGDLRPEERCGIFALCRYIEEENELVLI